MRPTQIVPYNGSYMAGLHFNISQTYISDSDRFISPHIGSLSDKYGRKRVLLITMIGNLLSAVV